MLHERSTRQDISARYSEHKEEHMRAVKLLKNYVVQYSEVHKIKLPSNEVPS